MKLTFALALSLILATPALAGPTGGSRPINGPSDLCYLQTQKVARGETDDLSTVACNRALRSSPLTRENRSLVLYNRGIIQQAQGDFDRARVSFERSVLKAQRVDMRHLALAVLAQKQGDYLEAVKLYDLLINTPNLGDDVAQRMAIVERNRIRALTALREQSGDAGLVVSSTNPSAR